MIHTDRTCKTLLFPPTQCTLKEWKHKIKWSLIITCRRSPSTTSIFPVKNLTSCIVSNWRLISELEQKKELKSRPSILQFQRHFFHWVYQKHSTHSGFSVEMRFVKKNRKHIRSILFQPIPTSVCLIADLSFPISMLSNSTFARTC